METRKPVFFISDQASFDLTFDIAEAFRAAGVPATLLTGVPEIPPSVNVPVIKIKHYNKSSTLKRIFSWLKGAWDLYKIFKKNPDAELFIISNPPVAPLLPLLLKNKFSLLLWDVWPDALVYTNTLSQSHPLVKFWEFLNKKSFPRAKKIFTISDGLAAALSRYVPRERIHIVPLWADVSRLKPLPKAGNLFLREQHLENKFIVMYSGNIGNTHPVEKLVDIANRLKNVPDIVFVIIGDGGKRETVRKRIEETGAGNVRLLPFQTREMFPQALAAADISVITLEIAAAQVSVPSKTYSSLAVGSPLLCLAGKNSELGAIVREHRVGEIFMPDETDAAADWILKIKNNPRERAEISARALEASKHFTPENAKKIIAELFPD